MSFDDDDLPWSLDRPPLSCAQVEKLVAEQFPALGVGKAEHLGEGWSFESFRWHSVRPDGGPGDKAFAFRFPKREEEVPGLLRERELLPFIAHRFELEVPTPELLGAPSSSFPYPFVGYTPLSGRGIYDLERPVTDEEVLRVFDIVRTFHAMGTGDARLAPLPDEAPDPEELCEALEEHIEVLGDHCPPWLNEVANKRLWEVDYPPPFEGTPVLLHGDLFDDHLRFDQHGRAIAVLDWTDVCVSDPAVDLAGLISFFGLSRLRRVTHEANDLDDGTWERADYLARANLLLDAATLRRQGHVEAAKVREGWIRQQIARGDFALPED